MILRLAFLVVTTMINFCDPALEADRSNDRMDTLLSYMVRMSDDMKLLSQKVDGVEKEVKNVAMVEELTSEHVIKLEDKVADVIDKQGKMEKQIKNEITKVTNQIVAVKNQIVDIKEQSQNQSGVIKQQVEEDSRTVRAMDRKMENEFTNITHQFNNVQKKIEKVESDFSSFGWKFIGHGVQKTLDAQIHTYVSTLRQCIEYCHMHRLVAGKEWNGLDFYWRNGWCSCDKNSRGIRTKGWEAYELFRIE